MRTIRWTTAIILAALAIGGVGPVDAQAPPPSVRASADGATIYYTRYCDGHVETAPSAMVFYLIHDGDPAMAPVVNVSWSGSLASDNGTELYDGTTGELPDQFVFDPSIESIEFGLFPTREGDLSLTIEPGSGYAVDSQNSATAQVVASYATTDCPPTTTIPAGQPEPGPSTASPAQPVSAQPSFTG